MNNRNIQNHHKLYICSYIKTCKIKCTELKLGKYFRKQFCHNLVGLFLNLKLLTKNMFPLFVSFFKIGIFIFSFR